VQGLFFDTAASDNHWRTCSSGCKSSNADRAASC